MSKIEFSRAGYLGILRTAIDVGYRLIPLRDCDLPPQGPRMIVRHDVDISLDFAVELAEYENRLGVRATYFVLPFNNLYNPLSPKGRDSIHRLIELGHEIGLHWDATLYPNDPYLLESAFRRDVQLLSEIAGEEIISASQHNPIDSRALNVENFIRYETYSEHIKMAFNYVSDSAMTWRQHTPTDLIESRVDIQFLAHPVWWIAEGKDICEKLSFLILKMHQGVECEVSQVRSYLLNCLENRVELDKAYAERNKAIVARSS